MNHMRNWKDIVGVIVLVSGAAATALATAGCGDVARQGRSASYLVIDTLSATRGGGSEAAGSSVLLSDVLTNVTSPDPCSTTAPCPTVFNDMGLVAFRLSPKDAVTIGVGNEPSTNNQVTVNRYRVVYRRSDGRNAPGVDVPYGFDGAATVTIPANGIASLGFELVRHVAKQEAPLRQLISSPTIITSIADVTFYGRDQVGNDISVTGSIQVDFGNFGDF
jgi:hypothetical protein